VTNLKWCETFKIGASHQNNRLQVGMKKKQLNYFEFIKSELSSMKDELANKFGVSSMGLFGSITRDDFTANSDIDILIEFTRPIGMDFITLADLLESRLQRKVDLITRDGIKPRYFEAIKDDLIYI
jgi:predicted nucleotidyltransferase